MAYGKRHLQHVMGALAGLLILTSTGTAQAQEFVATFGNWSVFTITQNTEKVCYIASAPVKEAGNYSKRGKPYALVTHRTATIDEVSVSSGYPYQADSKVKVEVDSKKSEFFTKGEIAWAYDQKQDADVVSAMKRGNRMTVRGTSPRGTYSIDTYSLKGITAAYNKMKSLCR